MRKYRIVAKRIFDENIKGIPVAVPLFMVEALSRRDARFLASQILHADCGEHCAMTFDIIELEFPTDELTPVLM